MTDPISSTLTTPRRGRRDRARIQLALRALVFAPLLLFLASCDARGEPTVEGSVAPTEPPPVTFEQDAPAAPTKPVPIASGKDVPTASPTTSPSPTVRAFHRPEWLDADHDCQSTRTEVLVLAASGPVEFEDARGCKVIRGSWRCPYTGEIIDDPAQLDVDHMVPLKNAWDSGASVWTDERWRQFANELNHAEHLRAVSASANRSKGARGPDQWLPPLAEARCSYVRDWAAIKARWQLSASEAEAGAIERALALCDAGRIPPLPQEPKADIQLPIPEPTPGDLIETCCKVCRKGKACGNTCIARNKTCNVGPGCACDG